MGTPHGSGSQQPPRDIEYGGAPPAFRVWLRLTMDLWGVTPQALAAAISVPALAVQAWLSGYEVPTPASRRRLAQYFEQGVRRIDLLCGDYKE